MSFFWKFDAEHACVKIMFWTRRRLSVSRLRLGRNRPIQLQNHELQWNFFDRIALSSSIQSVFKFQFFSWEFSPWSSFLISDTRLKILSSNSLLQIPLAVRLLYSAMNLHSSACPILLKEHNMEMLLWPWVENLDQRFADCVLGFWGFYCVLKWLSHT